MWYDQSVDDVFKALESGRDGLTAKEARRRLEKNGPNSLPQKKKPPIIFKFFAQFQDVLVIILLLATLLSYLLGDTIDAIAIFAIVLVNATIGFIQELQAERTLESLKEKEVSTTFVMRSGRRVQIPVSEVVTGDVVILEEGVNVPADARIFESFSLTVDESILTGESLPEQKDEHILPAKKLPLADLLNMVFKDTKITAGRGHAVVVATGRLTEIGKIARALAEQKSMKTPLTIELDRVSYRLTILIGIIATVIFTINMLGRLTFIESMLVSISLAVAAIPEGLPAIVTIVLSLGVKRLAEKKSIMKKLTAVETLGAVRIIATDKTGTITQNKINAVRLLLPDDTLLQIHGVGYDTKGTFHSADDTLIKPQKNNPLMYLLESAILASNASLGPGDTILGDTTEGALIVAGARAGLNPEDVRHRLPRVHENPFTSDRKMMSVVVPVPGKHSYRLIVKGAPEIIMPLCTSLSKDQKKRILSEADAFAESGLRSLAVAEKVYNFKNPGDAEHKSISESDLKFVGLFGMQDPLRPEVVTAIAKARTAGIRTIMITGDHKATAEAIAREAGIIWENKPEIRNPKSETNEENNKRRKNTNNADVLNLKHSNFEFASNFDIRASNIPHVLTESDIDALSDKELTETIRKGANVFARISPLGKLRIIVAIKRLPHMQIAVTGDGVNDAPALKAAHIGIAMGKTGTDLTREVADMVITDDNYATIIAAIKEGRVIFANLVKFIRYLISCNLSEVLVVTLGIIMNYPPPLLPIQILWINLITDGFPALALGMDPPEKDIMKRPPRDLSHGILHKKRWGYMVAEGTIIGLSVFILFAFIYERYSYEIAQTVAFTALGFSQLVHAFNNRSTRLSIFQLGIFTNRYLVLAVVISAILQYFVVQTATGNLIFKTIPMGAQLWILTIFFAFIPFIAVEIKKQLRFRLLP